MSAPGEHIVPASNWLSTRNVIKAGLIWAVEYSLLELIGEMSVALKIITGLIALGALGVFEKEQWLKNRKRGLFSGLSLLLAVIYVILFGYVYYQYTYTSQPGSGPTTISAPPHQQIIQSARIAWDTSNGMVRFAGTYAQSGENLGVYVSTEPLYPVGSSTIPIIFGATGGNPRVPITSIARFVRDQEINIVIAQIENVGGNQQIIRFGDGSMPGEKLGITYTGCLFYVIVVDKDNSEEIYPFLVISRSYENQINPPIIIAEGVLQHAATVAGWMR